MEEILTVGHSNHEERPFCELLAGAGVETLVDVRRNPRSRYEHFNRGPLAASLQTNGIEYLHLGEELGGRREPAPESPNRAWEEPAFRGYADHMASAEFTAGIDRVEKLAAERRTVLMCAEGDWRHCHRRLVADFLTARGHRVLHLAPDGALSEHEMTESAVVEGETVSYPETQMSLDV